jgi:hypothetical protein
VGDTATATRLKKVCAVIRAGEVPAALLFWRHEKGTAPGRPEHERAGNNPFHDIFLRPGTGFQFEQNDRNQRDDPEYRRSMPRVRGKHGTPQLQ